MTAPSGSFHFDANISMLFTHLPLLARPAAAAAAGFDAVEMWWPFDTPVPRDRDVDLLCRALADAGTQLVALNLDGGDTTAGDRGLISLPGQVDRVRANADAALAIMESTGCRIVNALYGNRLEGISCQRQDEIAQENLAVIATRATQISATVVLETLNSYDNPHYPLTTLAATKKTLAAVRDCADVDNVGLLFDVYHLHRMNYSLVEAVREAGTLIGHVQLADNPGRGRPGTGTIQFTDVLDELRLTGYHAYIGLEYVPSANLPDTLPEALAAHAA